MFLNASAVNDKRHDSAVVIRCLERGWLQRTKSTALFDPDDQCLKDFVQTFTEYNIPL